MIDESAKRSDFKDKISPHLEVLLQFSLSLTKNGRDAARLMHEAMAEAYQSWDESTPEEGCDLRLHSILTKRFFNGFQTTANSRQQPILSGESDGDVNYSGAIASLPAVFRSAMILSYLEGFSNREIANLAGVQPHVIESLLNRGRQLLREELFAHLMGSDGLDTVADLAVASG